MKYILKIINLNIYIENLPTKFSEQHYLRLTKEFDNAEGFDLEDLEYLDLEFIEESYEKSFNTKQKLEIEIKLIIKRNAD
jgi:hypothetical protein